MTGNLLKIGKCLLFTTLLATSQLVFAADVNQADITRPAGTEAFTTEDRVALVARGEALWNDKSLSKKGKTACASCHKGNTRTFKKTFLDAYPHYVKMAAKKADLQEITAEGMVQFCMLVPMKTETFAWDSEDLAALTAYTQDVVQPTYIEKKSGK